VAVSNNADELTDLASSGNGRWSSADGGPARRSTVTALQRMRTPFAMIGRTADAGWNPLCRYRLRRHGRCALDHLESLGHRHIALIEERHANSRFLGYGPQVRTDAAFERLGNERGLTSVTVGCDQTATAGAMVTEQLLAEHPASRPSWSATSRQRWASCWEFTEPAGPYPPTYRALLRHRKRSPHVEPALTIMRSPGDELAVSACRSLSNYSSTEPRLRHNSSLPWRSVNPRTAR